MSESPRKMASKGQKHSNPIAKKGPYKNQATNRRFSILSNSSDSSDSSDSSESDSAYDDHIYLNRQRKPSIAHNNAVASSGSDDDYSSSSDDENVDFVQLTKQRRLKAMKAVKSLKKQMTETSSVSPSPTQSPMPSENQLIEQQEPELDDDLVDAVIESEERRLDDLDENQSEGLNTSNKGDDSDDQNGELQNIDFDFSFDDEDGAGNNDNSKHAKSKPNGDSKNVLDQLRDEDIGEVVESTLDDVVVKTGDQKKEGLDSNQNSNSNDIRNTPSSNTKDSISNVILPKKTDKIYIDVPKFNEKEINSDADYEFDNNDLIQTLLKDNDELELQNLDNSDDDFDYLIANQHQINHNTISKSNNKDLSLDSIGSTENDYLMKEETQAMLDDYEKDDKFHNQFKNRRSSMYYQQSYNTLNENDLDDLDLDLLNNFEQFLPKQQAFRRRSSILNQSLLSSSDDDSDMDIDGLKQNKKLLKKKLKKIRRLTNSMINSANNTNHNIGNGVDDNGSINNSADNVSTVNTTTKSNAYAKDIRKMLGISNSDTNFTSKFSSNAIVDSDDDSKLLEYIFEDSESENIPQIMDHNLDGDETDEDTNLPKKSGKILGSKHAKEILSSSQNQFRAPKLGTFITKKPYSIIDGFTTRFLHPLDSNQSFMQRAASLNKNDMIANSNSNNSHIALDELLNISEFDEDNSTNEQKEGIDEFFTGDKRISLTAFRNKTSSNANSNSNSATTDLNLSSRRFSFNDRRNSRKHQKLPKSKVKSGKNAMQLKQTIPLGMPHSNISPQPIKSFKNKRSGSILQRAPSFSNSNPNLIQDPSAIDEVLLIGIESLPLSENISYAHNKNFEITAPHQQTSNRKRKSMSRSSKARIRRASIAEAHAEGLRQTRNGLFDEQVMDDVEALLIDMGDVEEYEFLFGNEI